VNPSTIQNINTCSPIYPRVNGRTLSVQGDRLVTSPAPKMTAKLESKVKVGKEEIWKQAEKRKN
jgi:hypothetical protein